MERMMSNLNAINKNLAGHKITDVYGDELGSGTMIMFFDNGTFLRFEHKNDGCIDSVSGVYGDLVGRNLVSIERSMDFVSDDYKLDSENDGHGVIDAFNITTDKASVIAVWCEPLEHDEGEVKLNHYINSTNSGRLEYMLLEKDCWYCDYETSNIYSAEAADFCRSQPDNFLGCRWVVCLGRVTPDFIREVGYDLFTIVCTKKQAEKYAKEGWSISERPNGLFAIFKFDKVAP